jgi:opacity protein-like surface antigen
VEASYSNQIGEITLQSGGRDFSDSVEEAGAVSILAGFQLGDGALIYARFGAAQAKLKAALSDFSQKHTGKLFGIGMKGAMTPNLALVLEYQNYDLKEKEGVKPDAVGVVVGVQYTF